MKAIIFDLDGTLFDVRTAFYWQFQELTRQYDGTAVTTTMINAAAHGTTEQIVRKLVRNTTTPFSEVLDRHKTLRIEACERYLKLYPGVVELLDELKGRGLKIAALTSGNHLTVEWLQRTGIDHHFESVVSAERVREPKPHPEGMYLALRELTVRAEDAAMVGDTVVDIQVGKNAEVHKTIGLTHGFGYAPDLLIAGADHVINDITALLDVLE